MSDADLTVRRHIRFSPAMLERLEALASAQTVSVSALVRQAVTRCFFMPAGDTICPTDGTVTIVSQDGRS